MKANDEKLPPRSTDLLKALFEADAKYGIVEQLPIPMESNWDALPLRNLLALAANYTTNPIRTILDVGCGCGTMTLTALQYRNQCNCILLDLTPVALEQAKKAVTSVIAGTVKCLCADIGSAKLPEACCDAIFACNVLRYLHDDQEYFSAYQQFFKALRPGGGLWVLDAICHDHPAVNRLMQQRHSEQLCRAWGHEFRQKVLSYQADTEKLHSLSFHQEMLQITGFHQIELLHKDFRLAAFGAIKQ